MKKTIILAFACLGIVCLAAGQTKPIVAMPSKPVITSKVPVIKLFPEKRFWVVKASHTTTNYNSNTQVKVWLEEDQDKALFLKFLASAPIIKVIENGSSSAELKEGLNSGYFTIGNDISPAVPKKSKYLIEFFEQGHPEKSFWVAEVEQIAFPVESSFPVK